MKSLKEYIDERNSQFTLTTDERKTLLDLDSEYGRLYKEFWFKWDRTDCKNLKEEFDKFMEHRNANQKYYPQLELVRDELDESWIVNAIDLKRKFENFNCYLSKFYIENIDYMLAQVNMTVHKDDPFILTKYNQMMTHEIDDETLAYAWKLVNEHPYEDVREEQPYKGTDIVDMMKSHMEKRGYGFKVELNPNMVARQNVEPHNKTLHIKTDADFSDLDVESLRIHEIDVHVARRYYGYKTGLNLFVDGLLYRNTLDEGLAIYQSLHHNKFGVKPNLQFDIGIKVIIGRYILENDFCEIYDMIIDKIKTDENSDIIDFILFKNICRFKRVLCDCRKLGGDSHGETDYLVGYLKIRDFDDDMRDDIIKYNIGPGQISELNNIKRFLKLNKFKSLI